MNLLLDTNIFLWFISNDPKLAVSHADAIRLKQNIVYLSAASVWEVAIKQQLGKITLPGPAGEYLPEMRAKHEMEPLPIVEAAIGELAGLQPFHRDPFDRMLLAQALHHQCTLVTVDAMMERYNVPLLPRA